MPSQPSWTAQPARLAEEPLPRLQRLGSSAAIVPPLEELGDLWSIFRRLSAELEPGTNLRVRYGAGRGFRLRPLHVANLLQLGGFRPLGTRRLTCGRETWAEVVRRPMQPLSCSVIVPCRDEVGNVDALVDRLPTIGTHTELIFVDGASRDGTPERIERLMQSRSDRDIKLLHQPGAGGKAAAVFQGFDAASYDVLMILDADMTVAPEDLPRFHLALAEGLATFANGTRFAYPMAERAMPRLNSVGNRAFGYLFSWLLGSRITDTLCGTKAFMRRDWPRLSAARARLGGHDPWGDFDLLVGAAMCGLHVIDVPVAYGARLAGESKMRPWEHGAALSRTWLAGWRELKGPGQRRSRDR